MLKNKFRLGRAVSEGIIFLLPVAILIVIYRWIYNFILTFAAPLSYLFFVKKTFPYIVLTVMIMVAVCYIVGVSIKTRHGRKIFGYVNRMLTILPGYAFILGIIIKIFRSNMSRFSSVVLVDLFGKGTLVTGFVTDSYGKMNTVFVPTGPNPTSGMIYHVKAERVHHVNVSVEDAMRSIISCGNGSKKLIEELKSRAK